MSYVEVIESFPEELRTPLARLVDALRSELSVQRTDFEELKAIVRDLAQAQARTEQRVEELAQAQKRTEERVDKLAAAMASLTEAHKSFERTFVMHVGGLGARWGMQSEEAFRAGMRTILSDVGLRTERFLKHDASGEVFGQPDQVELEIVITDGKTLVVEIKSAVERGDVYLFERKARFYSRDSGRAVDRKLMITPFADSAAKEVALRLGVEVCSDINALP